MAETAAFISSLINTGVPQGVPEIFQKPEDRALYEIMSGGFNSILSGVEIYGGFTQKPMTQWSRLQPSDTLRTHNLNRLYVIFTEVVAYGGLVNLWNNAGIRSARNATSATVGKKAHGFCNVNNSAQVGAGIGQYGEVIVGSGLLPVIGTVSGESLYLAPALGGIQNAPDVAVGHLEQFVGVGVAANLAFIHITMGQFLQH